MNYVVNSGQDIFDVTINTIVDINNIYSLLQANNIPSITAQIVGYEVTYTPPANVPPPIKSKPRAALVTSTDFVSIPNQSVYDITLQTYGDLNKVYKLMTESNFSSLLMYPIPNTLFNFNPTLVNDKVFASYLSKNGIVINTISTQRPITTNYLLQEDGLGFELEDGSGKIELE